MTSLDDWLRDLGLERYLPVFSRNDVDLETLGLLSESDLEKLGVSLGHRKLLLRAAANLERTRSGNERRPAAAHGERRQLTALFCDLVNSTEHGSRMDPESWREMIRRYADACARAIEHFDGHVFQFQGDAVVACFGYPRAHEDDPERAIRAALRILESMPALVLPDGGGLQARAGISTGLVVIDDIKSGERSAIGETMNLAARLQAVAEPGTIVVSDATHRLAGGAFEYEDRGNHALKGIPQPTRVWRVVGSGRAESRFAAMRGGSSPFVGRDREVALLLERWELARQGHGQAVILSGEPGIGKSRILHALHDRLGAATPDIQLQCSPFYVSTAFYPVADWLERELGFAAGEDAATRLDRLEALMVGRYACPLRDVALVASMLSLPIVERYEPLALTPQRQREETIRALVDLIEGASRRSATLMLFEDVHWADPTTIQMLDLLVRRLDSLPLLLLVTHRPEFQQKWGLHAHVKVVALSRLSAEHSTSLAAGLAGLRLPIGLLEQIVARTDGVPLYVEEVTRALLEAHADDGGKSHPRPPASAVTIPATLRDSLMERLDRLDADKSIAQIGAVLGREFSREMLRAVAPVSEPELDRGLERMLRSGLVVRRGTPREAIYAFRHALIQDAAYDSLLKSSRQQLHQKIAGALEERFPDTREKKPELLGHHYSAAGAHERAAAFWLKAGKSAAERSANLEAISHLGRGLEALKAAGHRPEHDAQELQLQTLLGNALMATKGYGAPEVGRTFDRARELCDRLGETPQLFPVLRGLWMFYLVRSELDTAGKLAAQVLQLAEQVRDDGVLLEAHRAMGMTRFFAGDFAVGRQHLEQGIALYDPVKHRQHAYLYGTDPGVACLCYLAASLWILGFPDTALARLADGQRLAEQCGHAFTRAFALFFAAMLHQYRRDATAARAHADADIALCKEEKFALWLAMATIVRGWTRFDAGREGEGLAEMRQGLDAYHATGAGLAHTYSLSMLAEACVRAGRGDEALHVLDEGLAVCQRSGERVFQAELYRLQGEAALRSVSGSKTSAGDASRAALPQHESAEASFLRALEIAREQGAKGFELRAASGLCRARRAMGRADDAPTALAEVYGTFAEGFDTPDLRDARRLLDGSG